jgi:VanZ family protein
LSVSSSQEARDPGNVSTGNGLAICAAMEEVPPMRTGLIIALFRILTWCCVTLLALLSLLPAQEMVRTGFPGGLEHFVAYAGSAAIAMAGYGTSRGVARITTCFWVYAGLLEYLQHFSPGRHPSIGDFAMSALGALCGGLGGLFLVRLSGVRHS